MRPRPASQPDGAARYRIQQGVLSVGFKLPELDRIIEAAFADVVGLIDAGTITTILSGRPA